MKALHAPILLALAMLALSAAPAAAQRLHIDIGGGHYGHGYHHHHHGHFWGPSFYYGYYAPPPVTYLYPAPVRREITYVVPQANTASAAASGLARIEARPNALPPQTGTVLIENPADSGSVVGFVVDEKTEVSLQPGESRVLSNSSSYLVEFDRGGNFGIARRTLGQGKFEFVATNSGWDLVSRRTASAQQAAARPSVQRNELPKLR
jgi:hypothetical protein